MSVRGEKPWPSAGTSRVRPRGESVAVYGEFLMAAVTRIVNRSGTLTLRAPARWPWADQFARRLATIRALPAPAG
jgi:hypothetical protein